MVHQTNKKTEQPQKKRLLQSQQSNFEGFDQTTYFFHKFGSCFNQLQVILDKKFWYSLKIMKLYHQATH